MLEDAAAELFVENTYAATTIDQIAQRAGVSRNTFFNYFAAKSDLLWVEMDAALLQLEAELSTASGPPFVALRAATLAAARQIGNDRVPLALTQDDVMGTREETRTSGLLRLARRSDLMAAFLASRLGRRENDLFVLVAANALAGAVSAAWTAWAADGIGRAPFADHVERALDVIMAGLEASLPAE
jgi:AcrR family transcriptional regulator